MSDRIEGKIAAILDKTTVVINRGLVHGVVHDDIFYIYTKIGPFFDPDTNENLGETTRIWGRVKVTILEDKFCVAKTQYQNPFVFNLTINIFGTTRIQLPVDEADITGYAEKVKVGFPVISERARTDSNILVEGIEEEKTKLLPSSETSRIVEDLVEDLASDLCDTDEQVVGAIADTNALGYGLDFYEIRSIEYDEDNQEISFEAKIELSGDQDQDKPFSGDSITVEVSGIITNTDDKWSIKSYKILSCKVNW